MLTRAHRGRRFASPLSDLLFKLTARAVFQISDDTDCERLRRQ